MESLKKMRTLAVLLLLVIRINIYSQNEDAVINAFKESYILENKGEYIKAADVMKKVYDEKSYEINLRLGWLNYESGLFTESSADYQRAISLMPYSEEARMGYVLPASALGNWTQVMEQYNKILENNPGNTIVNYRMGLIYYGKQDYLTALKYFEKVVNLYPFGYDALIMYAWCNLKLGKTTEAKVLFKKVLMYSPDDSSAKEGLGLIK